VAYNFKDFETDFPDDAASRKYLQSYVFSSLLAGLTPAKAAGETSI